MPRNKSSTPRSESSSGFSGSSAGSVSRPLQGAIHPLGKVSCPLASAGHQRVLQVVHSREQAVGSSIRVIRCPLLLLSETLAYYSKSGRTPSLSAAHINILLTTTCVHYICTVNIDKNNRCSDLFLLFNGFIQNTGLFKIIPLE